MRVPKKTILTVGLGLMFAACTRGPGFVDGDNLTRREHQRYRDSVLEVQMDSIVQWMDETYHVLRVYDAQLEFLLSTLPRGTVPDSIPMVPPDPPPPPCPPAPNYCPW